MTAIVFYERSAALYPVTIVAVEKPIEVADRGRVDVAADHAIDAAPPGSGSDLRLEPANDLDRILYLPLQVGRQRPIGLAE